MSHLRISNLFGILATTAALTGPISGNYAPAVETRGPFVEIQLFVDGSTPVTSGQSSPVDFGTVTTGDTVLRTFTILNAGEGVTLDVSDPTFPTGFFLQDPFPTSISPGDSTTFDLYLDTTVPGSFSGDVTFNTNDPASTSFTFPVSGVVEAGCASAPVVVSTFDSGPGTLRQAIADACADATITFDPALSGEIIFLASELLIDKPLTIEGPGAANLTIDGEESTRLVYIAGVNVSISGLTFENGRPGTPGKSQAKGVSFPDGGAIYIEQTAVPAKDVRGDNATVIVENCVFTANSGGNGGAIFNGADLFVDSCTFSNNFGTDSGGAVAGIGSLSNTSITNSTFSENGADGHGGGVYIGGDAVGLILTSTFTLNRADVNAGGFGDGGGVALESGICTVYNSLIAGNADDTPPPSTRGSNPFNLPDVAEVGTVAFNTQGYNLIGIGFGSSSFGDVGDQVGTFNNPIDAMLGPLADNGGLTPTHALLDGSPAINTGDPGFETPPDFDQRGPGFPRVLENNVDIGAFEFGRPQFVLEHAGNPVNSGDSFTFASTAPGETTTLSFTVRNVGSAPLILDAPLFDPEPFSQQAYPATLAPGEFADFDFLFSPTSAGYFFETVSLPSNDTTVSPFQVFLDGTACFSNITVTSIDDAGSGTLRQALLDICHFGTIDFDESLSGETILLTSGELVVDKPVTIIGLGADRLTISGNQQSRIFNVDTFSADFSGLRMVDGLASPTLTLKSAPGQKEIPIESGSGGAVLINDFRGNDRESVGIVFSDSVFENNTALFEGGAIHSSGILNVFGSTFVGNHADSSGGAVNGDDGYAYFRNSTFSANSAGHNGGAISNLYGTIEISFCTITENIADFDEDNYGDGGGLATVFEIIYIDNSIVAGNLDLSPGLSPPEKSSPFAENYPDVASVFQYSFFSGGYNLIGDNSGSVGFTDGVNNDRVGDSESPLDPMIGPLGNYGGTTPTHNLLPGSPAIDTANDSPPSIDQRGIDRPQGDGADIGAFERRTAPALILITGGNDQHANINTAFADPLAIRLEDGEGDGMPDQEIIFTVPELGASANITSALPAITDADGLTSVTVSANDTVGPYNVTADTSPTLELITASFNLRNTDVPVAVCQSLTVSADGNCEADIDASAFDDGSFDPDGGSLTFQAEPSGPYQLGTTNVTLTVTDDEGDTATCQTSITVNDTTGPNLTCPTNITVNASPGMCVAFVTVPVPNASDNCGSVLLTNDRTGTSNASGVYPTGTTTVTYTAEDEVENSTQCSFTVTVNCGISCSLNPSSVLVKPGTQQTVTLTLTANGGAATEIEVFFEVVSGPNSGANLLTSTDETGQASITLTSAVEGADFINVSGSIDGVDFECSSVIIWAYPIILDVDFPKDSTQGWVYVSPEPFTHPDSFVNDALGVTTADNTNSFGFWLSPTFTTGPKPGIDSKGIPVTADIAGRDLYRISFTVHSDVVNLSTVPTIRGRLNTQSLEQADVHIITAAGAGDLSPTPAGRTYQLYSLLPDSQNAFTLSFDVLNFDPLDTPNANLFLSHVTIEALGTSSLTGQSNHLSASFLNSNTNGWSFRDALPTLAPPLFAPTSQGLQLVGTLLAKGNPFVIQFGYWGSPEDTDAVVLQGGRLYAIEFEFGSSASANQISAVPAFRGRVNSRNYQASSYVLAESISSGSRIPTVGNPLVYTTYLETPAELDGQELLFSFDYLFVPGIGNDPTISVFLRGINVRSYDVPGNQP